MKYLPILLLLTFNTSCQSQSNQPKKELKVGGPCEGCEAWSEFGNQELTATDTITGFGANNPKLKITGKVLDLKGQPAKDVIIYIYHTDRQGVYAKPKNPQGWAVRHGKHRGWIKTDASGEYTFYTFRPARYPNTSLIEHIHMTVKEPGKSAYYIDDIVFTDDPSLTESMKNRFGGRAGSGIVTPEDQGPYYLIKRSIYLGQNIPDYSQQ